MTRRTRIILLVVVGAPILIAAAIVGVKAIAEIQERWAYKNWLAGKEQYRSEFLLRFLHDDDAQAAAYRDVARLTALFPFLIDGDIYPKGTYRGDCLANERRNHYAPPPARPVSVKYYWFDGKANDSGRCVIVIDGKVDRCGIVKG